MADVGSGFNPNLDKITEREVVPNFVSRLTLGEDFKDTINISGSNSSTKLVTRGKKLKDGVLINFSRTLDLSDIKHLDTIKSTYTEVAAGSTEVSIQIPTGGTLYRIVQEKTKQDVTDCFVQNNDKWEASFDVPTSHADIYKAYFY